MANNPAGEISLNLGITGPHYTIGAACAAGNAGLIQGAQMLRLGECDVALAGGVSESIHTFGIFASFKSQGALASHDDPTKASRPFDVERNGIVVAEGGCLFVLERLSDAQARGAQDLRRAGRLRHEQRRHDFRAAQSRAAGRMRVALALRGAGSRPDQIDIVSTHATGTGAGRRAGMRRPCGRRSPARARTLFNNSKSFIGHAMGAAGAPGTGRQLAGLSTTAFAMPTINVDRLDPECRAGGPGGRTSRAKMGRVDYILNNSFGMLGINSVVIVKRF